MRVKAQFCLNVSAVYLKVGDYTRANVYCNLALVVDPTYMRAYLRKCEVLEECKEFASVVLVGTQLQDLKTLQRNWASEDEEVYELIMQAIHNAEKMLG